MLRQLIWRAASPTYATSDYMILCIILYSHFIIFSYDLRLYPPKHHRSVWFYIYIRFSHIDFEFIQAIKLNFDGWIYFPLRGYSHSKFIILIKKYAIQNAIFSHSGSCTRITSLRILENQRKLHKKSANIVWQVREMCR